MTIGTRHLVLVGLMGTGKTTVGRMLAERLQRPLVDSDAVVEATMGRTVREIFETDGEAAYRVLETDALRKALAQPEPLVIAAAGGVVLSDVNRAALRESASVVVWLRAELDVMLARAVTGTHRPLLDGNPAGTLAQMAVDRQPLYQDVADVVVDTTDRPPEAIAEEILRSCPSDPARSGRSERTDRVLRRVRVPLGERGYDVVVGHGAVTELAAMLPPTARRAAIVSQVGIPFAVDLALPSTHVDIGRGEAHKTLATVEQLTRAFAAAGLTRGDVVIAVGGGMVTDVAGFAAASWHRGISVIHVATTLLGMVDAAIGGKTGVNLPEGKNLVGAFWQPAGVICDLDALDTLPARERRSGDGEMAKYHFLTGDDLVAMDLTARVARCVEIKAAFVAADEREEAGRGRRALLNYGHTLAHALEIASDHAVTHGEAVGIGLVYAAELAHRLSRIDADRVAAHRRVVGEQYGLATTLSPGTDADRLVDLMRRDKKAIDGLTFVLDGPDGVEVVTAVPESAVRAALAATA